MTGNHSDVVREHQQSVMNGAKELFRVTTGQVRTTNGTGKERVPRKQQFFLRKIETAAPLRMSRRMECDSLDSVNRNRLSIGQSNVRGEHLWRRDAQPRCLYIHHLHEWKVVLVVQNRSACTSLQLLGSGNVVDMGMRNNNLLHRQAMPSKHRHNRRNIVSGIDNNRLTRRLVAQNGAVALEQPDRKNLVDHALRVQANEERTRRPALCRYQGEAYFFGVLCCVVVCPERTEELSEEARDSRIVKPIEVSMKTIAE